MKNREGFAREGAFEWDFMKEAEYKHVKMSCEDRVPGEEGRARGKTDRKLHGGVYG